MQPLSKQNPVTADPAVTGGVASPPELPIGEWFWSEFDRLQSRWDVLQHPVLLRWIEGELSRGELAGYAEEHHHLLLALAELANRALGKAEGVLAFTLEDHAYDAHHRVYLWERFAQELGWLPELGWYYAAEPCNATVAFVRTMLDSGDRPLAHDLLTLYAAQGLQAQLAGRTLPALVRYYGFDDGPATEYFRHQMSAVQPSAALASAAAEVTFTDADPFSMLTHTEAVLRSHWDMLDAIEEDHRR